MSDPLREIEERIRLRRAEFERAARPPQPKAAPKRHRTAPRPRPTACEVCGASGGSHGVAFDHCHASGKFRGWLCGRCNMTLGAVNDDPDLLRRLSDYLRNAV